jgi:hypothetical protein
MRMKEKPKKIPFQFNVRDEIDQQLREYVYRKHHGYRKGLFAVEFELASTKLMESEKHE